MLTNTDLTIYHKYLNTTTKMEEYRRYYFKKCWKYETKGTNVDEGYEASGQVQIRIPGDENENWESAEIDIGDVIFIGKGPHEIRQQKDLNNSYNITSITINTFGNNAHIHIGGR